jgi:hypothetical protein
MIEVRIAGVSSGVDFCLRHLDGEVSSMRFS